MLNKKLSLVSEYNQAALGSIQAWSRLVLPDQDLPQVSSALNTYFQLPEHMNDNDRILCLKNAADMASQYFDDDLHGTQKDNKYDARYELLKKSVEQEDGSMIFIRDEDQFYGYVRVLPITNESWQEYLDHQSFSEAEFKVCNPNLLVNGQASLFFQALVFPEFPKMKPQDKRILQESGFAGLIGRFLPDDLPEEGINIYFTAFHPYTDRLASRLDIDVVGENKNGHSIYGFNIGKNASEHTLGYEIYERLQQGKRPCDLFSGMNY